MPRIDQLLHRRSDLSTFLVHLTRHGAEPDTARSRLLSIAQSSTVEARTPLGPAAAYEQYLGHSVATQKVACFTETPLEHTWMMLEPIEGRQIQFEPYGIAITKVAARQAHFNPVWYTDISTRGGRSWPVDAVNRLVAVALQASGSPGTVDSDVLQSQEIFRITPFIEQMGPTRAGRKEFWWEREWRHVGDYVITVPNRIVAIFAPEDDHVAFKGELQQTAPRWADRPLLDPRWGLERMLVELANIDPGVVGPFP